MSVEIARRLLDGGWVPRADVEVALLQGVIRGVPFVQALAERRPDLTALVERELSHAGVPVLRTVNPRRDLWVALPLGMCERLLALPVRQEAITKTVDVAAVDPFDGHVKQEFSFQLDAPVRILRAPLDALLVALEGLHSGGDFVRGVHRILGVDDESSEIGEASAPSPATEVAGDESLPRRFSSYPPIPLVQKQRGPLSGKATSPGLGESATAGSVQEDEHGDPVIDLTRTKLDPEAVTRSRLREADLAQVEKELAGSKSPDEVVSVVTEHACPEGSAIVFSVKQTEYVARAASFAVDGLRDVSVARSHPSVFQAASESGHYLGMLPETLVHALLRDLLASRLGPEVYVVPAFVSKRPTLMLLVTGFERSFSATVRADRIATAAGAALERLVLDRKRQH